MSSPLPLTASSANGVFTHERSANEAGAAYPLSDDTLTLLRELFRQETAVRQRRAQLRALRYGRPVAV